MIGVGLMFLIDEGMTIREIKKEIDEILKPIKVFCKRWDVQFHYEADAIVMKPVIEKIDELIILLNQQEDEQLKARVGKFDKLKKDLDLLAKSIGQLKDLEVALIYNVLLADRMQAELVEDKWMWEEFQIKNISTPKVCYLYQEACSSLLEMIRYNQILAGS